MNKSDLEDMEDLLDVVETAPNRSTQQKDDAIVAKRMDAAALEMAARKTYNPSTDYQSTTWTSQGMYAEMVSKRRPMSASAAVSSSSGEKDQSRSTKLMSTLPAVVPSGRSQGMTKRPQNDLQNDGPAVGSLLDKHIRQLQNQTSNFVVPIIKVTDHFPRFIE